MSPLDGDLLDLEPVLRDAVVLALPLSPCAGTTARACAPNAESGWPTTRTTARGSSTPGGRHCRD